MKVKINKKAYIKALKDMKVSKNKDLLKDNEKCVAISYVDEYWGDGTEDNNDEMDDLLKDLKY